MVLLGLLNEKDFVSVNHLANKLGKDRSVIQRGLFSLMEKNLVKREQSNKDKGGYLFLYSTNGKQKIKESIIHKSESFCTLVKKTVNSW